MNPRRSWIQGCGQRNRLNRLSKVSAWGIWLGVGLRYSALSRARNRLSNAAFSDSQGCSRVCRMGTANTGVSFNAVAVIAPYLPSRHSFLYRPDKARAYADEG